MKCHENEMKRWKMPVKCEAGGLRCKGEVWGRGGKGMNHEQVVAELGPVRRIQVQHKNINTLNGPALKVRRS